MYLLLYGSAIVSLSGYQRMTALAHGRNQGDVIVRFRRRTLTAGGKCSPVRAGTQRHDSGGQGRPASMAPVPPPENPRGDEGQVPQLPITRPPNRHLPPTTKMPPLPRLPPLRPRLQTIKVPGCRWQRECRA